MRVTVNPPTDPSAYPFHHSFRVRFAETDAMGIVHNGAYSLYLEEARVEYLRSIGRPYNELHDSGLDMAVLEVWVSYRLPLRFDEVVDVGLALAAGTRATLQIAYCLSVEGSVRATAVTVHGCVDRAGRPRRLPDWAVVRPPEEAPR